MYIVKEGYHDCSELVLQLMMEGGSLEPAVIKVPKEDVDVVSPRDEVDEVVTESVSDSAERDVETNESVSNM
jgi:hypothetical protein